MLPLKKFTRAAALLKFYFQSTPRGLLVSNQLSASYRSGRWRKKILQPRDGHLESKEQRHEQEIYFGADADLTMLKKLGVQTEQGKLTEVPVYNPETFETNVPGIYVAGHFTHARHIKAAIDVPRQIVPLLAQKLKAQTLAG